MRRSSYFASGLGSTIVTSRHPPSGQYQTRAVGYTLTVIGTEHAASRARPGRRSRRGRRRHPARWRRGVTPLALLLVAVTLKGLLWSLVIPIWHAPDEPDHVIYAQTLERHPTWRPGPTRLVPEEVHVLNSLMQLSTVALHPDRRFDLGNPAAIAATKRDLAGRYLQEHEVPRNAPRDFTGYHPPLYYWLGAAILRPLARVDLLTRVAALRLLSVALGTLLVAATYWFARLALPGRPVAALAVAALAGFQPQASFTMATYNNLVLEIALFTALLIPCALLLRQAPAPRQRWLLALALALVLAAGLLTRTSFLAAAAPLAVTMLVDLARAWRLGRWRASGVALASWGLVGGLALLLILPWYGAALRTGGASTLATLGPGHENRPPVTLASFIQHYDYARYTNDLFKGYWGLFGWEDTLLPLPLYDALRWFCLLTLLGLGLFLARRLLGSGRKANREPRVSWSLLALTATAAVAYLVVYVAIEYRIAVVLRSITVLQGRYYLPGLAAQFLLVLLAWEAFVPARWRAVPALALVAALVAFNWYALFGVLVPRYVGAEPSAFLGVPWDRLTLLAPPFERPPLLVAVFLLALATQAVWLLVLGLRIFTTEIAEKRP